MLIRWQLLSGTARNLLFLRSVLLIYYNSSDFYWQLFPSRGSSNYTFDWTSPNQTRSKKKRMLFLNLSLNARTHAHTHTKLELSGKLRVAQVSSKRLQIASKTSVSPFLAAYLSPNKERRTESCGGRDEKWSRNSWPTWENKHRNKPSFVSEKKRGIKT